MDLLKETDWFMNEAGDITRTEAARSIIGEHTKLITCLAKWNKQDPLEVVNHAKKEILVFLVSQNLF